MSNIGGKALPNLETFDQHAAVVSLSPRSSEACFSLGIDPSDLLARDLAYYQRTLPKSKQQQIPNFAVHVHAHKEKKRVARLAACRRTRKDIIQCAASAPTAAEALDLAKQRDARLCAERTKLERMKQRQLLKLNNMLHAEIVREEILNKQRIMLENEEKRQQKIEAEKEEKARQAAIQREKLEARIQRTAERNAEMERKRKEAFEAQERLAEEHRRAFEEKRRLAFEEARQKAIAKQEAISRTKALAHEQLEDFKRRTREKEAATTALLEKRESEREQEREEAKKREAEKELRRKEIKRQRDRIAEERVSGILDKKYAADARRQEIHAKRMDRMMQQRIEQEITRMDKLDHVSTIHRKQEYRKQKMLAKMETDAMRIQQMKAEVKEIEKARLAMRAKNKAQTIQVLERFQQFKASGGLKNLDPHTADVVSLGLINPDDDDLKLPEAKIRPFPKKDHTFKKTPKQAYYSKTSSF